jgi:hypothetical protein
VWTTHPALTLCPYVDETHRITLDLVLIQKIEIFTPVD